jgi:hypothetical protein
MQLWEQWLHGINTVPFSQGNYFDAVVAYRELMNDDHQEMKNLHSDDAPADKLDSMLPQRENNSDVSMDYHDL